VKLRPSYFHRSVPLRSLPAKISAPSSSTGTFCGSTGVIETPVSTNRPLLSSRPGSIVGAVVWIALAGSSSRSVGIRPENWPTMP
jgi:hypothetical protein